MKMNFFIEGQALRLQDQSTMVADTYNYLDADFTFRTSDWRGMKKFAHFQQGKSVFEFPLDGNDQITKDKGINLWAGRWEIFLHGDRYEDGKVVERITTTACAVSVQSSGIMGGEAFPDVSPDMTAELLAQIDQLKQEVAVLKGETTTPPEDSGNEDNTGTETDPDASSDVATDEEANDVFDGVWSEETTNA